MNGQAPDQAILGLAETVAVGPVPASARVLEVWYPLIGDDARQRVMDLAWDLDHPVRLLHDPEHGNPLLYLRCLRPDRLRFTVSFLLGIACGQPAGPAQSGDRLDQAVRLLEEARRYPHDA